MRLFKGGIAAAFALLLMAWGCSKSKDAGPSAPDPASSPRLVGLWHLDDPTLAGDRGLDLRVHADGRIELSKVGAAAPSVTGSGAFDGDSLSGTWRHASTSLSGTFSARMLGEDDMEFVFVENLAGGDKVVTYRGTRTG